MDKQTRYVVCEYKYQNKGTMLQKILTQAKNCLENNKHTQCDQRYFNENSDCRFSNKLRNLYYYTSYFGTDTYTSHFVTHKQLCFGKKPENTELNTSSVLFSTQRWEDGLDTVCLMQVAALFVIKQIWLIH